MYNFIFRLPVVCVCKCKYNIGITYIFLLNWQCIGQWFSTGVPQELLLNIQKGVFGEVAKLL